MALTVLDASVVVGILDDRDVHHERAWRAVHAFDHATLVIPVSAFSEVLVGVHRGGPAAARIFDTFCRQLAVRVEPITEAVGRTAAGIRLRHRALRLPDALVIATGDELGADAVLTADRRWRGVSKRVRVV